MAHETPGHASQAGRWRGILSGNILGLGLVSLLTDVSSEMIYPLLPVFITGLVPVGLAAIYVGAMEGIAEATASLLKLVSGRLSDRWRRRKALVVLGYGISTVGRPCMALASAGWQVIALRFGDRIGKGIRSSPRDALLSQSIDASSRGLAFSFHRAMDHTGAVLGPVLSIGVLYVLLGHGLWLDRTVQVGPAEMRALRWLFGLAAIPGLAALLVLVTRVREVSPRPSPVASPAGQPALSRRFYLFIGAVTLFALGNSSDLFLVFYAQTRFGLDLLELVLLWIVLHVSKVVWSLPGGALSDRLGRQPLIISGWIVYALVYLGLAFAAEVWQLWGLIAIYGLYYGLCEGAEKALVADFVSAGERGFAYGIYHGAVGLAALPASLVFGVFWSAIGPKMAFGIGAGLAGSAILLMLGALALARRPPG